MKPSELVGQRFGRLTVVHRCGSKNGKATWFCVCECGGSTVSTSGNLKQGVSTACGCRRIKHGHTINKTASPTFKTWHSMMGRCLDTKHKNYYRYGGRGIRVDSKWLTFSGFLSDMGERPEGTTLDRIDNDSGYTKSNCRWADIETQSNNKKNSRYINIDGTTQTLTQWARHMNVQPPNIYAYAARKKITLEEAVMYFMWRAK